MRNEILRYLNKIEADYHVKILYACESGSRVWGYSTSSSDYDVRFVYVHHPDYYLSIDPIGVGNKRDVIEQTPNELLDLVGWDITKALKMFRKSNPSFLEWLYSPIGYSEKNDYAKTMRELTDSIFSPRTCLFHYLKMAEGNVKEAERRTEFQIKKWINVLRPILAAKWIEEKQSFPPLSLQSLLECVKEEDEISEISQKILARNPEAAFEKLPLFSDYVKRELHRILTKAQNLNEHPGNHTEALNHLFRKTLKKAWQDHE